MKDGSFSGKVAIVTGGGSGIGREVAILLARGGAVVVVADISVEGGQGTLDLIAKEGRKAHFYQRDVTRADQAADTVEQTVKTHGGLHVLANILGGAPHRKTVVDTTEDEWEAMMRLNLTHVFLMSRAAVPHIKASGGGSIVNVGALGAGTAGAGLVKNAPLAAAKGGVIALTKAMAADHAADGIRVNAISPGGVLSPQLFRNRTPEEIKYIAGLCLLGRMGEPVELARAAVFLASEDASYITGQILAVDGGR